MDFTNFAQAGLTNAIQVMGTSFVWQTNTYSGVQSPNHAKFDLEAGGFVADANFTLTCLKSDFVTPPSSTPVLPVAGDEITLASKVYRIAAPPRTNETDPGFVLDCEGINK